MPAFHGPITSLSSRSPTNTISLAGTSAEFTMGDETVGSVMLHLQRRRAAGRGR